MTPLRLTIVVEYPNGLSAQAQADVKRAVQTFMEDQMYGTVTKAELAPSEAADAD